MAENNDDDYTQIFGVGSELGAPPLLFGFAAVAAYLLIFSSVLDKLEALTFGTSYHLVLQRIYREIMMVGFGSFAFTILNQTNTSLPYGLNTAFGFADICCFAMSSFFCLQGVFIMLLSVKQAQNWNVASQIPAEELLHNMSVWELSHPLAWRSRFLPFCPTREQVEFRVLKSIFATAYNIKASHNEFDFAIFLRMSHENNIVKLIDITFKNWFYILFLITVQSTTNLYHDSSCSTDMCDTQEDLKVFISSGFVTCLLSIIAWLWGRDLELRLISSAGVENVDDYSIFLMTEFRTEEKLSDVATSATSAKDIIANYLKEKEISEVETKETQYLTRQSIFSRATRERVSFSSPLRRFSDRNSKKRALYASTYSPATGRHELGSKQLGSFDAINEHNIDNDGNLIMEVPCVDEAKSEEEEGADQFDLSGGHNDNSRGPLSSERLKISSRKVAALESLDSDSERVGSSRSGAIHPMDTPEVEEQGSPHSPTPADRALQRRGNDGSNDSQQTLTCLTTSSSTSDESRAINYPKRPSNQDNESENELQNRGNSMIVKRNKKKFLRLSSGEQRRAFMDRTLKGVGKTRRKLSRQASDGWRASVESMFSRTSSKDCQLSANEREARFSTIVKSNFGKQNFKDLFLFKRPSLFYGLISFVITCNSLYLAWLATNYMFVIFEMDGYMTRLWYILVTLAPPIITFPTIFLAIRSSTIMKAITLLDLTVVAKVIEQSEVNTTMLAEFRKTILNFMKKDGPGIEGMITCCNRFARGDSNVLRKSDFREMLLCNKVIYTPEKIDFLFGSIDLNGGSTVDYGELETFLFADDNYESDQKRQELFHKMSIHKMKGMRKQVTKKGDNPVQRILRGLNFETFRQKHFLSED